MIKNIFKKIGFKKEPAKCSKCYFPLNKEKRCPACEYMSCLEFNTSDLKLHYFIETDVICLYTYEDGKYSFVGVDNPGRTYENLINVYNNEINVLKEYKDKYLYLTEESELKKYLDNQNYLQRIEDKMKECDECVKNYTNYYGDTSFSKIKDFNERKEEILNMDKKMMIESILKLNLISFKKNFFIYKQDNYTNEEYKKVGVLDFALFNDRGELIGAIIKGEEQKEFLDKNKVPYICYPLLEVKAIEETVMNFINTLKRHEEDLKQAIELLDMMSREDSFDDEEGFEMNIPYKHQEHKEYISKSDLGFKDEEEN